MGAGVFSSIFTVVGLYLHLARSSAHAGRSDRGGSFSHPMGERNSSSSWVPSTSPPWTQAGLFHPITKKRLSIVDLGGRGKGRKREGRKSTLPNDIVEASSIKMHKGYEIEKAIRPNVSPLSTETVKNNGL